MFKILFLRIFFLFFSLNILLSCSKEIKEIEKLKPLVIVERAILWTEPPTQKKITGIKSKSNWVLTDNAGWVVEKSVNNGGLVKAGQTILRLDPRDLRLSDSSARYQYEAAKASLKAHRADFMRFNELKNKKFISDAEWERRKAQLSVYEAEFEEFADKLGVISVRAHANGKIKSFSVQEGQLLKAGERVAQLIMLKESFPKKSTNNLEKKNKLYSGIKIPLTALINGKTVFKIFPDETAEQIRTGEGVVKEVSVSIGKIDESSVLVTSGLKDGELYVVSGGHLLTEAQKVRFSY